MMRALFFLAGIVPALCSQAVTVGLMNLFNSACSEPTGSIDIYVIGGSPPYSFVWNNGATTEDLTGLSPGTYSVIVTDANSDQASGSWNVLTTDLSSTWMNAQDGHASCIGSSGGQVQVIEWTINGQPPYTYDPPPDGIDPQGDPFFVFPFSPPGSEVLIGVSDANGCTGTLTQPIVSPQLFGGPDMLVTNIQGSCSAGAGGAATISNINDGMFFSGPDHILLDAAEQTIDYGYNAPDAITFNALPPGDYHFIRDWDPSDVYMAYPCDGNPHDRIDFTIPDLGPDCGSVSGTVFIDNDQDCVQDGAEIGVPYQVLEILPGPEYAITNGDGQYAFDIVDGGYTLGQTDPSLIQLCPVTAPVPFNIASNQSTIDLADSSTVPLDLSSAMISTAMRPGFGGTFWAHVRNLSPQVSGPATITFTLDDDLVYAGASPVPTSVNGNTLTWDLAAFTALQGLDVDVFVSVPVGTPLGTPLSSSINASNPLTEATLTNNTASVNAVVVGSYDPNAKTARTSTGWSDTQYFIDLDEWIDYTIQFQNTGTDTAFNVVITDTLAAELDMASFQQGVASHPFSVAFKPGRVVEWTFAGILLPDSGTNEAASHGLVAFRIRPVQPLSPGTLIANTANIFFDFNEPVITAPSELIAEFSTGAQDHFTARASVLPNPATDHIRLSPNERNDRVRSWMIVAADGRPVDQGAGRFPPQGIDVDDLRSGSYVLRLFTDDGCLCERFVKIERP